MGCKNRHNYNNDRDYNIYNAMDCKNDYNNRGSNCGKDGKKDCTSDNPNRNNRRICNQYQN
jgi:hypothetical protein